MKSLVFGAFLMVAQVSSPGQTMATSDAVNTLRKEAQSTADQETKSLTSDLGTKTASLSQSLEGNLDAQKQLESVMKAVLGDKGPAAVEGLQKLTLAKFAPEQTRLAKDVYHLGSAYVVKKNLGSVEGSQAEVSQIVSSLRKGTPTEALPALKTLSQNARLTEPQKDLVASLMNNYAPGVKKAADSIKALPGLKK